MAVNSLFIIVNCSTFRDNVLFPISRCIKCDLNVQAPRMAWCMLLEAENNMTERVGKSLPINRTNIVRGVRKRVFHPDLFGYLPLTATASDGRPIMTIRVAKRDAATTGHFYLAVRPSSDQNDHQGWPRRGQ